MLEVVNLTKTYTSKAGISVKALDSVNIKFSETGMVFVVGKSGSGKSTLLNVLGGLDGYDLGDIIINNTSTSFFKQSDFDSYRNTYIGFVFQEYNVLKDFTVGANVALAIQLQGQVASDEKINSILKTVDLDGYGSRRPNELSGGQLQRVAIARALVKNPQIILADEPSGALDSNSAIQVFDTLKRLSKEKLVIIVSHDLDFASRYATRIIELSDGKIISDVERKENKNVEDVEDETKAVDDNNDNENKSSLLFLNNSIRIPQAYHLTEKDREDINKYIDTLSGNVLLNVKTGRTLDDVLQNGDFEKTNTDNIVREKNVFEPIKSKLPMKTAIKMGASSLKKRPVRLFFTILLCLISFTQFASISVISSFNARRSTIDSIIDSKLSYATIVKTENNDVSFSDYLYNLSMDDTDIQTLSNDFGLKFKGVYSPYTMSDSFSSNVYYSENSVSRNSSYYTFNFNGMVEYNASDISECGYEIMSGGRLPVADNEIVMPKYLTEAFITDGYIAKNTTEKQVITAPTDMVGKTITLIDTFTGGEIDFTIVGILDTKENFDRYSELKEMTEANAFNNENILKTLIKQVEFSSFISNSCNSSMIVNNGYIAKHYNKYSAYIGANNIGGMEITYNSSEGIRYEYFDYLVNYDTIKDKVVWKNEAYTQLSDSQIIVSKSIYDEVDGTGSKLLSIFSNIENAKLLPSEKEITIVGYFDNNESDNDSATLLYGNRNLVVSDNYYNLLVSKKSKPYDRAISNMPRDSKSVERIVDKSMKSVGNTKYELLNHITMYVQIVEAVFSVLKIIFYFLGIVSAIFAALLFGNYISVGIVDKRNEIGVLRALGARGADIFRIFFSESAIIAIGNFVLTTLVTGLFVALANSVLRNSGFLVTILSFGIWQVLSVLLISALIAFIASIIPISKISRKKPIDAIKFR